jgi:hypothetical protein
VLFTLGGVFALFEGVEKLRHPTRSRTSASPSPCSAWPSSSRATRCARR